MTAAFPGIAENIKSAIIHYTSIKIDIGVGHGHDVNFNQHDEFGLQLYYQSSIPPMDNVGLTDSVGVLFKYVRHLNASSANHCKTMSLYLKRVEMRY